MYVELMALVNASDIDNKAELISGLEHEIELVSKKSSKSKAKLDAEEELKTVVLTTLIALDKAVTVTEIVTELNHQYTNPKITSILTKLLKENKVAREVISKKAYYSAIVE